MGGTLRASWLLSSLPQLGTGRNPTLYLLLFPGAPDSPLTLGTTGFRAWRGRWLGMGAVTQRPCPSSEGLRSRPQPCRLCDGLDHIPSARLDWGPFKIGTFFLKNGCRSATPGPGPVA